MGIYKRGDVYWYRFNWFGEQIRESTKQSNARVAREIEAARRTSLAKGEVGLRDRKPAPTLGEFAEKDFLPFVRTTSAAKPNTVRFYQNSVNNLEAVPALAKLRIDSINPEIISSYVAKRQADKVEISTINRDLATLRRMLRLAQEWGKVQTVLTRVRMLPGENQRERVLTLDEEKKYLKAANEIAYDLEKYYARALEGIRAKQRGEIPIKPDAYLLRDVTTILLDCGLRPEECYRLRWENIREGAVEIFTGKRRASRRRIPASQRVLSTLAMRREVFTSQWVFPASTKSGHMEDSTIKKQHAKALELSQVPAFVLYDLRHTCLTRWAKGMDTFTLKKLAGHEDLKTTLRYVHLNDDDVRAAMKKAAQSEHNRKDAQNEASSKTVANA